MRIGIILTAGSARGDVELAVRAEAAGFDGVFTIEFFNRHGYVPLGAMSVSDPLDTALRMSARIFVTVGSAVGVWPVADATFSRFTDVPP